MSFIPGLETVQQTDIMFNTDPLMTLITTIMVCSSGSVCT